MAAVLEALAHRGPDGAGACAFQSSTAPRRARPSPPRHHRPERRAPADVRRCRRRRADVQRRDLQLPRAARRARAPRLPLRARLRHRGAAARLPALGRRRARALRGMFAFALWDARKRAAAARARPLRREAALPLRERAARCYFASEIKALLRMPRRAARGRSARRCATTSPTATCPGPRTLFRGIRKLAPATYALWQFGRLREVRYWTAARPRTACRSETRRADAVRALSGRAREAVQLQMVSDVPFGAFLSGGLDSSGAGGAR